MSTDQNQTLGIELRMSKEKYAPEEPITASVTLKNQSRAPISVNKRMAINPGRMPPSTWEVKFDVVSPPGERNIIVTLINRGKPRQSHFVRLSPGEQISRDYVLTEFYWMGLPGTYEVKATYNNHIDGSPFGFCAWTGEVTSNPVTFKVDG